MTMHGDPPHKGKGKEQVRGLLQRGELDLQALEALVAEQKKISEGTNSEANTIVQATNEPVKPRLYSLSDASTFLKEHDISIDLTKAREDHVRDMVRWGAVAKSNDGRYGASFDKIQVPEQALLALVQQLEAHPALEWESVLELKNRTNGQAYNQDIIEGGVNHDEVRTLDKYLEIDPNTGRVLKNQDPMNKPHLVFTPSMTNVDSRFLKISANDQLAKMRTGAKYMPPSRWVQLFLRSLDKGLRALYPDVNIDNLSFDEYKALRTKGLKDSKIYPYLLDTETVTQFPDLRSVDGLRKDQIKEADLTSAVAPNLDFDAHPDFRQVYLYYYNPAHPHVYLGGRPELG